MIFSPQIRQEIVQFQCSKNCLSREMRGEVKQESSLYSYVSPESRVPSKHPLRSIKRTADQILLRMSGIFTMLYSGRGRCSIPPETLLKSLLLQALYGIRSERLLCEMLEYNLLFRWFLDMSADSKVFDHSTLSANRSRLLEQEVAQEFFEEVVRYAREKNLLSDERFTVDGSQIEAWASFKSFKPKDDQDKDGGDFRGKRRLNDTHQSTTDPEAKLFRKGNGKEAKMSYSLHILSDSQNNLLVGVSMTQAGTKCEWEAATTMLDKHADAFDITPDIVTADKAYHQQAFINDLRERGIKPHIALQGKRRCEGLDKRTTRHPSYRCSQFVRKFVEHPFGWMKAQANMRKPKVRGLKRMNFHALLQAISFNILRISNLLPA